MKKILLSLSLIAFGCDGIIHQAGAEAKKQCQAVLDEELPKVEANVWQECSTYFEETAIPAVQAKLEFEIETYLTNLGCVKIDMTWDCRGICK